ncbi:MAG: hypothetical protein V3V22_02375 [Methylococcales bacterium]
MMNSRLLLFATLLLLTLTSVTAEPLIVNPFVKGSFAEIKSQRQGRPFVLVFWSESCSYCMKELAMFGKLRKRYPEIELVTVATDPFLEVTTVNKVLFRSQLDIKQTWVFAEQFPERIYADINKRWRGELPATHFFSRDNTETRHMGIVKEDELIEWMSEQSSQ